MNARITNETVRESMHKQIAAQPTWTTRIINSSQLKSKQDYQRKIDMGYVKEKIAQFDPNKVEPVHVSYRDGKYFVMDGQHTILILEGVNGNKPVDIKFKLKNISVKCKLCSKYH